MRPRHPDKVLVVAGDTVLVGSLVNRISGTIDAHITYAATGRDALDIDCIESHHLVLIGENLPDMTALVLAERIIELRRRPVVLIVERARKSILLGALRLGIMDVLTLPLDMVQVSAVVERGLRRDYFARREQRRHERLRCLMRQVLRERRGLNQRIELICRDVVAAHRRLFHRVLNMEQSARLHASRG